MRLFLFRTKSQPGATYESVAYKKNNVMLFRSPLKMKK